MPARPDIAPLRRVRALALALALAAAGPAAAGIVGQARDAALDEGIARLSALVAEGGDTVRPAADLLAQSGLAGLLPVSAPAGLAPPRPAPVARNGALEGAAIDLRMALSLMVQVAGPADSRAVQTAQGPASDMRALVIRQGTATLADVQALLAQFDLQPPKGSGDLVLRVPLVIWDDAALRLGPGETLGLSRTDGAFVVNFGHLQMDGAAIAGLGPQNPHLPRFSPFVATVGSGSLRIADSRLSDLGFGRTRPFAGLSLLRNALMPERERSYLRDSLIQRGVSVVLAAAADVEVTGNSFVGSRGEGLILSASPRARVTANLFVGQSEFNAIQVVEGSSDAVVSGNAVLGGTKAGIVVRSASHRPHVAGNLVWRRVGGGITVERSDCALVRGNQVIENSQKGIEVRASAGTLVQGNRVMANRSAGIWVSAQQPGDPTFVTANLLLGNRAGLASASGAHVVLRGNDFHRQYPRFLAGDLALQSPLVAADLDGARPLLLTSGGPLDLPPGLAPCARE